MSLKPVTQTFTAGGNEYLIANSSLSLGLDQTLGFQCTADIDANPGLPAIAPGMDFVLSQQGDGVQTYKGIIRAVTFQRGENFTRWNVEGLGYSDAASHIRILRTFGPGGSSQILADAWGEFGPPGVVLDIDPGAPEIDEYESVYNSLIELTNYVCSSTGWNWSLDDGVFRFFDPMAREDGSATHMDFERGTLQANRDMSGLFNVARQSAYQYIIVAYGRPGARRDCWSNTFMTTAPEVGDLPLQEWEVVEIEPSLILVPGASPQNVTFSMNAERSAVISSFPIVRGQFMVTYRRPVWAQVEDGASIALYGRREAPNIASAGSDEVSEAIRRLQTYVNERAYPVLNLTGDFNRTDIAPGMRMFFDLPELQVSRLMVVDQVRRSMARDDLQVSISCRAVIDRPGQEMRPATPRPDIAPEIFRRLDRLENSSLAPKTAAGMVWLDQNPIGADIGFSGSYTWAGGFTVEGIPSPSAITISEDEV